MFKELLFKKKSIRLNLIFTIIGCALILYAARAHANSLLCRQTGQVFPMSSINDEVSEQMVEINKVNSIQAATKDFQGFCEWNRMDRSSGDLSRDDKSSFHRYVSEKRLGNKVEAGKTLSQLSSSPWQASLRGNRQAKLIDGNKLGRGGSKFYGVYAEASGDPEAGSVQLNKFAAKMVSSLDAEFPQSYNSPQYGDIKTPSASFKERAGLCSGVVGVLSISGCSSALGKLLPKLEVSQENASTLDPKLLKRTLEEKQITNALKAVAISVWKKIEANKFKSSDNIYSELLKEFSKEGLSPADSKSKALQIMGTLSIGGPTYAARANPAEVASFPKCAESCNPNNIFLAAIAEGMVHADTIKMDQAPAKLYSLPTNIDFPCDSGKSYHFWMSAYYSHLLVQEGVSPEASRAAVFVSHLGYQIARDEQIGGGGNDLLRMGRFTSPENGTRMDLVLSSAGAKFGINPEDSETIQARDVYIEVLKSGDTDATKEEWKTVADPRKYFKWLDRIGAKTALDAF